MTDLIIQPSEKSPGIDCSFGIITFSGRSISANAVSPFDAVLPWIRSYLRNPAEETVVTARFEYIDAHSSQSLLNIIRQLKKVENKGFVLLVNWYYEYGDLEMLELGELIQARLEMEFDFIEMDAAPDSLL
jgi:hypothetical protein